MKKSEIHERLFEAAKTLVRNYDHADQMSPIEKVAAYSPEIAGITRAALFLLDTDDYYQFMKEVRALGVVV